MRPAFFQKNRQRLGQALQGGVFIVTAYASLQRSNDMAFAFEQEANFWWLTGIERPDWWLIYDGARNRSWLVKPDVDDVHQLFDGSLSTEQAAGISGVDEVISRTAAEQLLRDMARRHSQAYALGESSHAKYYDFVSNPAPKKLYELCERTFAAVQDCRSDIAKLRAIKQPEELAAIEKAVRLTTAAFCDVKAKFANYQAEYQIEADFSHYFRSHGARGHAYDPIVASGANACTLHYVDNHASIGKKDLVLIDIGARVSGYAADITRTYASQAPTARQREVHTAVVEASREIIKLIAPGIPVEEYQRSVDSIMRTKVSELGLVKDPQGDEFRKFFPHAISHGLGVDVHDSLGAPRTFAEHMVLTVEPGIYIPDEKIGVRIEDDIVVTAKGYRNLSASLSTDC